MYSETMHLIFGMLEYGQKISLDTNNFKIKGYEKTNCIIDALCRHQRVCSANINDGR